MESVQTVQASGVLTAPSGVAFTSPFFLLFAALQGQKIASSEKSTEVTYVLPRKSRVSPGTALGCEALGVENRDRPWEIWISPDPARQYSSPYAYSPNPINSVDPDGNWQITPTNCTDNGVAAFEGFTYPNGVYPISLRLALPISEPGLENTSLDFLMLAFSPSISSGMAKEVFWSGGGQAKFAAQGFARSTGRVTLDMTRVGKGLDRLGLDATPELWNYGGRQAWERASANFAEGVSGNANVFFRNGAQSNMGSIWNTVEKPIITGKGYDYLPR